MERPAPRGPRGLRSQSHFRRRRRALGARHPQGDFLIGDYDVKMGEIGGAPFYIRGSQYEALKHADIVIDVVPGRGGMFSLDNGRERRFLVRSDMCALPGAPAG